MSRAQSPDGAAGRRRLVEVQQGDVRVVRQPLQLRPVARKADDPEGTTRREFHLGGKGELGAALHGQAIQHRGHELMDRQSARHGQADRPPGLLAPAAARRSRHRVGRPPAPAGPRSTAGAPPLSSNGCKLGGRARAARRRPRRPRPLPTAPTGCWRTAAAPRPGQSSNAWRIRRARRGPRSARRPAWSARRRSLPLGKG